MILFILYFNILQSDSFQNELLAFGRFISVPISPINLWRDQFRVIVCKFMAKIVFHHKFMVKIVKHSVHKDVGALDSVY